jgi:hypothetical protein
MTDEPAIVRLRLSADSPSALAEALELARDDVPRAEQMHELEAALMPLLSGGAKSGTTSKLPKRPVAAGAALGVKLLMAAAVAAAGVGGALHHFAAQSRAVSMAVPASAPAVPSLRPAEPARVAPVDEIEHQRAPASAEPAEAEYRAIAHAHAGAGVTLAPSTETAVTAAPTAGTGEAVFPDATGSAEVTLLERAQRALRTDPAAALALTDEDARQFPAGALTQEREFVAIEALAALGRRGDATTRADTFRARFPDSAHLRRLDLLLRPTSDDAP